MDLMSNLDLQGKGMTSQRTRNRLVDRLREQGITDATVLELIGRLPRHVFIDEALAHRAYEDTALPIGDGQTISQPYVVALMSQLLFEQPRRKVLEIGTGCGYQSAVLSHLAEEVYTVERIARLHHKARSTCQNLRLRNITFRLGDGYEGWERFAPFDGILVAAAPAQVPPALIEQLAVGGRLVIPVGGQNEQAQQLKVLDRTSAGLETQIFDHVRFVPMLSGTAGGQ